MRKTGIFILLLFSGLCIVFYNSLNQQREEIEGFTLPSLFTDDERLNSSDISGKPYVVNLFSSWCLSCLAEHEIWMDIMAKNHNVKIYGINYLDTREKAIEWLATNGNPYEAVGMDYSGSVARNLGVRGVPETFVFDSRGVMQTHIVGNINFDIWHNQILPLLR